jgi:hypothetical protein
MKTLAIALTCVLFSAVTAAAGEMAVSDSTLKGMGLASMSPLSDTDGLAIRGKGPFDSMPWQTANWPFPSTQTHGAPTGPPAPPSNDPTGPNFPSFPGFSGGSGSLFGGLFGSNGFNINLFNF